MKIKNIVLTLIILIFAVACGNITTPEETNNGGDIPPIATPTIIANDSIENDAGVSPTNIMIWLPPQFSPDESEAGVLLANQLNTFMNLHPTVRIETRIKSESGDNDLLNSVYQASLTAPIAMPDIIALPTQKLIEGFNLDLLTPFSDEASSFVEDNSFDFAKEFTAHNSVRFGIPFASEIILLAYRPLTNPEPPINWEELLLSEGRLAFPGADIQSVITLVLYQSRGGGIINSDQTIEFDRDFLKSVFDLIVQGTESNLFPFWLTQFQTDEQAWIAITENRAQLSISWSRNYLLGNNPSIVSSALPTKNSTSFTYGKGWMWSITNPDVDKQAILEALTLHLSSPSFLAEWTALTGYYPTEGNVLELWPENQNTDLGWQSLPSAIALPSEEVLNSVGGSLQTVVEQILKQEIDSVEATNQIFSVLNP